MPGRDEVFEFGMYGGVSLVDPYTGQRLYVSDACGEAGELPVYDTLALAVRVARAVDFLGEIGHGGMRLMPGAGETTPTGPVPLHTKMTKLIEQYGIDAVKATFDYQAEVLDDQADSDPELAAKVRQSIDQANDKEG